MPGLTLADQLAATRAQLDTLASALGRADVEAIEASAHALAHLVEALPSAAAFSAPGRTGDVASVDSAMIDALQWQLVRNRRLGLLASSVAPASTAERLYRPNGTTLRPSAAVARASRLEVAG